MARRRGIPPPATRGNPRHRSIRRGLTRKVGCRGWPQYGRAQGQNVTCDPARSSMTHGAISELSEPDAVLRDQRLAKRFTVTGRRPDHVGNLVLWPQMRSRIAVAVETELHRQGHSAIGQRHLIDAAVAFDAADTLVDVDVVAKEHIVRQ